MFHCLQCDAQQCRTYHDRPSLPTSLISYISATATIVCEKAPFTDMVSEPFAATSNSRMLWQSLTSASRSASPTDLETTATFCVKESCSFWIWPAQLQRVKQLTVFYDEIVLDLNKFMYSSTVLLAFIENCLLSSVACRNYQHILFLTTGFA